MTTEYHGPFLETYNYKISVDGYLVPVVRGRKNPDGSWSLLLDDRFAIDVKENEIQDWMWFLSNAMAVSAGYSCFGENCKPINPFMIQIARLDMDEKSVGLADIFPVNTK